MNSQKSVLILGANSDVAKQCILQYLAKGFSVIAASRNLKSLEYFVDDNGLDKNKISLQYFDATDFSSHQNFYNNLEIKPNVVIYAAGFLVQNNQAFEDFDATFNMIKTNYAGAVSILNIIAMDKTNNNLERIVGLSSLSGVRGRKSNFIYGSAKAAFTAYLSGLRNYLFSKKVHVMTVKPGFMETKMTEGLPLNPKLTATPKQAAECIYKAYKKQKNIVYVLPIWRLIMLIIIHIPEFIFKKLKL